MVPRSILLQDDAPVAEGGGVLLLEFGRLLPRQATQRQEVPDLQRPRTVSTNKYREILEVDL